MGRRLIPGVDKISESWVKDHIKRILVSYGPSLKWDMPPANIYGNAGRHDFYICQNGLFWTIEAKAGKNGPTELQIGYAEDVRQAGGLSILVNEANVSLVQRVADFVSGNRLLPHGLATDFLKYRK